MRSFGDLTFDEHFMMHHDDVKAVNTADNPNNIVPVKGPVGVFEAGQFSAKIPALSWNVLRFKK